MKEVDQNGTNLKVDLETLVNEYALHLHVGMTARNFANYIYIAIVNLVNTVHVASEELTQDDNFESTIVEIAARHGLNVETKASSLADELNAFLKTHVSEKLEKESE
jgi:hypothetical protein